MIKYIFRWDLDKTYIKTEFETVRGLIKAAFQKPEEKETFPGADSLIREIQTTPEHEIFFISGSPEQMRKVLEEKLKIDGIRWKKLVLKPNLQNLLRGRIRALREQVSYKLPVLLKERLYAPENSKEILIGDDAETDAFIYSLYADILKGNVRPATLEAVLRLAGATHDIIEDALNTMAKLLKKDAVEKIFIHLEKKTPPARFDVFGTRLVPVYNYFQVAVVLNYMGVITVESVVRVLTDLMVLHGYSAARLGNSFQDLVRREFITVKFAKEFLDKISKLIKKELIYVPEQFADRIKSISENIQKIEPSSSTIKEPEFIDYPTLYVEFTHREKEKKKSVLEKLLE